MTQAILKKKTSPGKPPCDGTGHKDYAELAMEHLNSIEESIRGVDERGHTYLSYSAAHVIAAFMAGMEKQAASEAPETVADESGCGQGLRQMPPPGAITDAAYLAGWFDGQQYLIDNATPPNPTTGGAVREALDAAKKAKDAMREMFRYFDGGETRGSYDGKPERAGLRNAWYGLRSALAALAKHGGAEG